MKNKTDILLYNVIALNILVLVLAIVVAFQSQAGPVSDTQPSVEESLVLTPPTEDSSSPAANGDPIVETRSADVSEYEEGVVNGFVSSKIANGFVITTPSDVERTIRVNGSTVFESPVVDQMPNPSLEALSPEDSVNVSCVDDNIEDCTAESVIIIPFFDVEEETLDS